VKIRSSIHKGLRSLYNEDVAKGVPSDTADKLRKMFAHTLTGDRKGTWSLSVTGNRRLTFRIDTAERKICDMNLEDFH
jgi:proteic killer suppression protein